MTTFISDDDGDDDVRGGPRDSCWFTKKGKGVDRSGKKQRETYFLQHTHTHKLYFARVLRIFADISQNAPLFLSFLPLPTTL